MYICIYTFRYTINHFKHLTIMGRKKQLPKRRRFTSPKHSLLHSVWSMKSPDSFKDDFMRFMDRACKQEEHWIDTTGSMEYEERNRKRNEANATYHRLFKKKINSILKPCECFFSEQEENQLKVIEAFLDDNGKLRDEFHVRRSEVMAARLFLMHYLTRQIMERNSTSMVLDVPYTTPN